MSGGGNPPQPRGIKMYKKCNCEDWPCCGHVYDDDEASIDDEVLDYDDEEDDYGGDFILFRDEEGNIRFIDNR